MQTGTGDVFCPLKPPCHQHDRTLRLLPLLKRPLRAPPSRPHTRVKAAKKKERACSVKMKVSRQRHPHSRRPRSTLYLHRSHILAPGDARFRNYSMATLGARNSYWRAALWSRLIEVENCYECSSLPVDAHAKGGSAALGLPGDIKGSSSSLV